MCILKHKVTLFLLYIFPNNHYVSFNILNTLMCLYIDYIYTYSLCYLLILNFDTLKLDLRVSMYIVIVYYLLREYIFALNTC